MLRVCRLKSSNFSPTRQSSAHFENERPSTIVPVLSPGPSRGLTAAASTGASLSKSDIAQPRSASPPSVSRFTASASQIPVLDFRRSPSPPSRSSSVSSERHSADTKKRNGASSGGSHSLVPMLDPLKAPRSLSPSTRFEKLSSPPAPPPVDNRSKSGDREVCD